MKKEKYHCPFSDDCRYGKSFPEKKRYQIIEGTERDKPVFKDEEIKPIKYKCKALENEEVSCSWIKKLNLTELSNAMSFTALKNTDCIAYALKMTEGEE